MNLAEAIVLAAKPKGPPCGVRLLLESLDETDRQVMVEALQNPGYTTAHLFRTIQLAGLMHVGENAIMRHRNGSCRCPQ